MESYRKLIEDNAVKTVLNLVYVDDKNWAGKKLSKGRRWDDREGKLIWREELEREDTEKQESDDHRTMKELRRMANTIERDIKMTLISFVGNTGKHNVNT